MQSIYDRVMDFIAAPVPDRFEDLALEVFCHQVAEVAPYRVLCRSLGVDPASIDRIDDIPPVSTLAFKYARLASEHRNASERIFLTSGTTIGREERGTHIVPRPEVYRASAIAHLRRMLFPDGHRMRILAMHPTADRMEESSLSQMLSWCIEAFGADRCECVADRATIDVAAALAFLRDAQVERAPVCILATTASLGALFAHLKAREAPLTLPPLSRIMDTGGAKGQAIPLDAAAVCNRARELLGIAPEYVINEYGMTELCSQLYDATSFNSNDHSAPGERIKIAPPWMRAAAIDPMNLKPVASGEVGLLRFIDLANVGSVSAILTEDFGTVNARGDRVQVLGRAGLAEPRGCALAIAEFEANEHRRIQ
jgi:acyl-protein synthetase LuxE